MWVKSAVWIELSYLGLPNKQRNLCFYFLWAVVVGAAGFNNLSQKEEIEYYFQLSVLTVTWQVKPAPW